ncbi:MAG: glycosyltransferase family 2 protein [Pyrinomonadaceae bacterium]
MSIPFVGVPVLNRGDLLTRCVESLDYPVARIVVINNGDDEGVRESLSSLREGRPNLEVVKPAHNLGVAGSWNFFLREYDAPYHLICGSDIQFAPGDLEKIQRFAESHPEDAIMFGNHGYSIFALRRRGVETVGYFDENFYPAYLEDCDYAYRLKLLGARASNVPGINAVHGEAPYWGSSTILSDPTYRERNGVTHGNNFTYYRAKWGGINGEEIYPYPFNDPSRSPKEWTLDGAHRVANDIWGA